MTVYMCLSFLLVCLALPVNARTYWMDSSCSGKLPPNTLDEVVSMASEGAARLPNDAIFADAFQKIFKVGVENADTNRQVTTAFQTIAGMTRTDDLKSSDLRIYCDNDARWVLVPDLPLSGKKSKNSKKPPDLQEWWDPINFIYRKRGSYGCADEYAETQAQTFKLTAGLPDDKGKAAGHNLHREVITICNLALAGKPPYIFSQIPARFDKSKMGMNMAEDFLSITIFHEMCHSEFTIAIPGGSATSPEPNGWDETIALPASQALIAAESYAFLAFTALLNRNNLRLSAGQAQARGGALEWIIPPTAPVNPPSARLRALRFFA